MTHCPDRDQLERLLDRRLGDTEGEELERHVRRLPPCQQTLER